MPASVGACHACRPVFPAGAMFASILQQICEFGMTEIALRRGIR